MRLAFPNFRALGKSEGASHLRRALPTFAAAALVSAAARHPVSGAVFSLAATGAWMIGRTSALTSLCMVTIATGSSSMSIVKHFGTSQRWVALGLLAAWPLVAGVSLRFPSRRVIISTGTLVAWCAMSAWWSVDPKITLERLGTFAIMLWVALVVFPSLFPTGRDRESMLLWLCVALVAGAIVALGLAVVAPSVGRPNGPVQGWLENTNTMGLWCAAFAPCLLVLPRRLGVPAGAIVGILILLTASRTAAMGLVLIGIAALVLSRRIRAVLTLAAVVLVGGVALAATGTPTFIQKFSSPTGLAKTLTGSRSEAWVATANLIELQPSIGFGFGSAETTFALADVKKTFIDFSGTNPNNAYLQFVLETGFVGLALLLVSLILLAREVDWRALGDLRNASFHAAAMFLFIAALIESLLTGAGNPFAVWAWASLALAATVSPRTGSTKALRSSSESSAGTSAKLRADARTRLRALTDVRRVKAVVSKW